MTTHRNQTQNTRTTGGGGGVQSVERTFALLEAITSAGGEVQISTLAEMTQMPLPTIHRLLRTLVSNGYVRQLPNRHYGLGPRLIRFGEVASQQLGAWARPTMAVLTQTLQESSNMAVLDGDMATYVAQVPSGHSMRMFTEVGRRVHTHCSGVGKAMLSLLGDDDVRAIMSRAGMPAPTPRSLATQESLLADLTRIRARGYAIDDEEQEIGVRCIAVPVHGMPSPTAISISGPITRVDDNFRLRAVPLLKETAWKIANQHATTPRY